MINKIPITPDFECKFQHNTEDGLFCKMSNKIAKIALNNCKSCELGNFWRNVKCRYINGRIMASGPRRDRPGYWIAHEKFCELKGEEIKDVNKCIVCEDKILE